MLTWREFVEISYRQNVRKLAAHLGSTFQKPRLSVSSRRNKLLHWLELTLHTIDRVAKRRLWLILFVDEDSFAQCGSLCYT